MTAHRRPQLLGLSEAAEYLFATERFMRSLVARRLITYYKIGGRLKFDTADLDALLLSTCVRKGQS